MECIISIPLYNDESKGYSISSIVFHVTLDQKKYYDEDHKFLYEQSKIINVKKVDI